MIGPLEKVSPSTQAALDFAQAAALARRGSSTEVDSFDLVFGILLAHPGTSPAQRCMDHFRFTLGDIKPPDHLVASVDELNAELAGLDPEVTMPLGHEAPGSRGRPGHGVGRSVAGQRRPRPPPAPVDGGHRPPRPARSSMRWRPS